MILARYLPPDACFDDPAFNIDPVMDDSVLPFAMAGEALHRVFDWIMRGSVEQRSLRFHLVALHICPQLLPCKSPSVSWCAKVHGVSRRQASHLRQDFVREWGGTMRLRVLRKP